jgi:AraC-like DNA-binding protein
MMSQLIYERSLSEGVAPPKGHRTAGAAIHVRSAASIEVGSSFTLGTVTCTLFTSPGAVEVVSARERRMTGITLGLVLEGETRVSQAGRTLLLRPGQFAFYSAAKPLVISSSGAHAYLAVSIPLFTIGLPLVDLSKIFATDVPGRAGSVALLASALTSLAAGHPTMSARARMHCGTAVAALAQAVISDHVGGPTTKRLRLFNLLAQWIEEHLTDGDLDAERLAAEHHLSARYVRQIFAESGTTVTRFVRERRLEHVRADLVDPSSAALGIAAVARQWRFDDASVFSRAFRAQYGQTPREYQAANTRR